VPSRPPSGCRSGPAWGLASRSRQQLPGDLRDEPEDDRWPVVGHRQLWRLVGDVAAVHRGPRRDRFDVTGDGVAVAWSTEQDVQRHGARVGAVLRGVAPERPRWDRGRRVGGPGDPDPVKSPAAGLRGVLHRPWSSARSASPKRADPTQVHHLPWVGDHPPGSRWFGCATRSCAVRSAANA